MKLNRFTDEQIIGIPKELKADTPVAELCRKGAVNWRMPLLHAFFRAVRLLSLSDSCQLGLSLTHREFSKIL